jgi:DUF4097 and DUF4098 domain-containing protein YvlB
MKWKGVGQMGLFSRVGKREEFPVSSEINALELHGFNGSVQWVPVDEEGARIVVEKEVRGLNAGVLDEVLEDLNVESTSSQGKLVLRAVNPRRSFGLFSVQVCFTVYASPEQIGDFQARTSNGSITVDVPFNGKLHLKTANGRVVLQSGSGEVQITTSNGRVDLGKFIFQGSSSVRTSNGGISGQVEFPEDGSYTFQSTNGSIQLRVPHDTPGSFQVATSNGGVEFRVGNDHMEGSKQVEIQRSSSPSVKISTSNGTIEVLGY